MARGCYEVSEARLRDRLVELAGRVDPAAEWAGLSSALHSTNAGKLTERRARVTRVAAEAGLVPPGEAAVTAVEWLLDAPELAWRTPDEAARDWLAAAPANAEALCDRRLDEADTRAARLLRNELHGLRHLPPLLSPDVADALRPWLELRPRLLAG
ncbi:hypothetical protein [Actinosynnema pretiosum]|uniref:Uncharacterized protein n=1 Tax=Actinosynnema pretiosum TaxID=42197 RepID=A0A290Z8G7_9PSEU|nr:hypothetical protein [Actinosynnema pretiosum]ATE55310.1 hypothetical protein CNX65_20155 [Actinosynnema pretiosum]